MEKLVTKLKQLNKGVLRKKSILDSVKRESIKRISIHYSRQFGKQTTIIVQLKQKKKLRGTKVFIRKLMIITLRLILKSNRLTRKVTS